MTHFKVTATSVGITPYILFWCKRIYWGFHLHAFLWLLSIVCNAHEV
jgi:hypothetical protein